MIEYVLRGGEEWGLQYFPAPLFSIFVSIHVQTSLSTQALFHGIPETHSKSFAETFSHPSGSWTVVMTAAAGWRMEEFFGTTAKSIRTSYLQMLELDLHGGDQKYRHHSSASLGTLCSCGIASLCPHLERVAWDESVPASSSLLLESKTA